MSGLRKVTIFCDGPRCELFDGEAGQPNETFDAVRTRLMLMGWRKRGKRDICPFCWNEGVR